ncbi:hypothetical protein ST47_g9412 [Ascochyta rabiei]|uniref:Heterokaryon incompatibility domain-containing protein n=1 Tax=Didymella rabiei TaxID=5454 RepID=A0A162XAD2_DIDRA|nr:hypothetical protein ST47_g9412 [Ascochyta rabiei]
MRLLNASTHELESFLGSEKPQYAILSHTWEPDGEVLFQDLQSASGKGWRQKSGCSKVLNTCNRALQDGYKYVWIDTCCIDKSSSAELSEAINSMFRWYQQSSTCYAYLSDIDRGTSGLSSSRWFNRGWTLQELIAPGDVTFYNKDWKFLGSRSSLASEISAVTGIQKQLLTRLGQTAQDVIHGISIASRMRWASKRITTREEDIAYCLMGIFDVNMPLLYGEGKKAFLRLQEAIIRGSEDQSILAFRHPSPPSLDQMFVYGFGPVLAPDLSCFCEEIQHEWYASNRIKTLKYEHGSLTLHVPIVKLLSGPWLWKQNHTTENSTTYTIDPIPFRKCSSTPVLLKVSANYASIVSVLGGGGTIFKVPNLNDLRIQSARTLITIEGVRTDTVQPHASLPVVMDYAMLLQYCSIGPAFPSLPVAHQQSVLFNSIGIIAFMFDSEHFFVTWGHDGQPWCCIHSLESLRSEHEFEAAPGSQDYDAAEDVVRYVQRNQTDDVGGLAALFKVGNFTWKPSDTSPHFVIGTSQRLQITRVHREVEFIGRRMFQVKLVPQLVQQSAATKKPWFRLPKVQKDNKKDDKSL